MCKYDEFVFQLELVLIVEKLQELRSMRVQKLKKQGLLSSSHSLFICFPLCILLWNWISFYVVQLAAWKLP